MEQVRNKREEYHIKQDILNCLVFLNKTEHQLGHYESFMQDHIMHVAVDSDGSDLIVRLDKRVKRDVLADKSNAFSSRVTQQQGSQYGLRYYLNSEELSYVLADLEMLVQKEKEKEKDPIVAWGMVFGRREEVRQSSVELYKSLDVKLTFY
jgi:hypothetical protein